MAELEVTRRHLSRIQVPALPWPPAASALLCCMAHHLILWGSLIALAANASVTSDSRLVHLQGAFPNYHHFNFLLFNFKFDRSSYLKRFMQI